MSVLVASQSLAAAALYTGSSFPFTPSSVLQATITNGATPPSQQCQVALELSVDNANWVEADRRFGLAGPSAVSYQTFDLANYWGNTSSYANGAGTGGGPTGTNFLWTNFRFKFSGNNDQAVTIAANDGDAANMAVVTLTGTANTSGGAMGSWTPPQGGPVIIQGVTVYCTANSGGAANLSVGVAANAATNSVTLINAAAIGGANNTIIVSGTGNGATVSGLLTTTQAVTFTGSANTVGFAGKAYISYIKP
jgi:hypothetical protein